MKKLAGLVIILAVLVLCGYYGMGVLTERTIKEDVRVINQSNGLLADVEEYNRGFFSSDAKIKWRLHLPERVVSDGNDGSQTVPAQDYQMDMPIKIFHGPFIFANHHVKFGMGYAESVVPFPEKYQSKFDELFTKESQKPQMDLSIFVNYLAHSTLDLSVPAFNLKAKDGKGDVNWMGMDSKTTVSSNLDKINGNFNIDGINVTSADSKMTIGKITIDYDLHKTDGGLYLGSASSKFPSLSVVAKDKKVFEIADMDMSSDSDITNSLFSTHFNLGIKSVNANGLAYGPAELEMSLRNLDAEVLAQINQQANAMQNGTEAERQQAMMAMLPELPKLFSKGAEFEISKLSVKLPEGTIEGNLIFTMPKGENANPFELVQKTVGDARLKMPKAVLKQLVQQSVLQQMSKQPDMQQALIQQMQSAQGANQTTAAPTPEQLASMQADRQIATMEQNGLIVTENTDYVVQMNLEQGKFSVNGKPFEPSMLRF